MSNSYAHKLMTVRNGWAELLKAIACIVVFYTLFSFMHSDTYNVVQLASLPALIGVVHFLFRLCSVDVISRLFTTTLLGTVMKIVGSLCLEIYLVHFVFLTDMCNNLFPLNILLYFLIVLCEMYSPHMVTDLQGCSIRLEGCIPMGMILLVSLVIALYVKSNQ